MGYYNNSNKYVECHSDIETKQASDQIYGGLTDLWSCERSDNPAINKFVDHIIKLAKDCINQIINPKPMNPLTSKQKYNFQILHIVICVLMHYNNMNIEELNIRAMHYILSPDQLHINLFT